MKLTSVQLRVELGDGNGEGASAREVCAWPQLEKVL